MKAGIYLRVSTEEQRERQSIATQRGELLRYCDAHALVAPAEYADDGVSGTVPFEQRPGGARLLNDARAGRLKRLLIYKLDRFGRDTRVILNAIKQLEDLGVEITATSEPYDSSTPAGRFLTTIMAGTATLERENIRERALAGIHRLVREGAWVGGIVPYGYRVQGHRSSARLVVSEDPVPGTGLSEADVVRLVFGMIGNQGASSVSVAEHLNRIGVPPAYARDAQRGKRFRRTSGTWRDSRVRCMVRNATYRGVHIYGKHPNSGNGDGAQGRIERPVPAIVEPALWERAQTALRRNFLFGRRNAKREYLLRGLIKCAHCGWTFCGTETRGVRYYICGGRVQGKKGSGCKAKQVNGAEIEGAVWGEIEGFLRNPGPVLEELACEMAVASRDTASVQHRLTEMKGALAGKDGERDRVIALFRRGRIGESTLDRQLDEIERERTGLADEIAQLMDAGARAREAEGRLKGVRELLRELNCRLEEPLTFGLKRRLVETLVEGMRVETVGEGSERDSHVSVTYCFDVPDVSIATRMPA